MPATVYLLIFAGSFVCAAVGVAVSEGIRWTWNRLTKGK